MKTSPRDNSIGAQMAIALQLIKKRQQKVISDLGFKITMEQLVVIEVLDANGDMNMTELAKTVWKQNANITRIVDKLEKKQYVVRKAVEGDRRANMLSVTDSGIELLKIVIPKLEKCYKKMISCITDEEETIMLKKLKKIIGHISQTE